MAFVPVYGTGFEYGTLPFVSGITQSGGVYIDSSIKHTGSYGLRLDGASTWVKFDIPSYGSYLDFGLWNYKNSSGRIDCLAHLSDGKEVGIRINGATGVIQAVVDGSAVASGIWVIPQATWFNVQVRLYINDAGYIQVRFDGNNDIDYSGDTKPGSSVTIDSLYLKYRDNATNDKIDDIVLGSGGWSGDVRFDGLFPDADSSPLEWMKTGFSLAPAPSAPTVATGASPGLTGDYYYKVSFVDTDGETVASAASALVQPTDDSVDLSDIDIGPDGTTARKIYRTEAGGATYKLVTTIADNVTTTYNDTVADGALGATLPVNSPHYTEIDEKPASTADYIWTDVDEAQDLFTIGDWDATKKEPILVMHWAYCQKVTADDQQLKFLLKSGATLATSAAKDPYTSNAMVYEASVLDPDGAAWTDDVIDDLEIGVELVGAS